MRRENLSELHLLMDGFGVSWMVSPKSGSGLLVEGGSGRMESFLPEGL